MKIFLFTISLVLIFITCKKSDGNSAPEIKFKKIASPVFNSSNSAIKPILTISVKDADGDFGFKEGADSSFIFIKNVSFAPFKLDSFKFPSNLGSANIINNWVQAEIVMNNSGSGAGTNVIYGSTRPQPKTDTLYFEVYMKDFKKNKSNVIRTADPMLLVF
jgi:hypothetical protein